MPTEINTAAPDFSLPDLSGKVHQLSAARGAIAIVNFWSCECVHSERTDRLIVPALTLWRDAVEFFAIASNRNESVPALKTAAAARALPRVLLDAECRVADLYGAQTTPHVFVIDRDGILRYRGALDDVSFRQRIPSRFFLDEVVGSLLAKHPKGEGQLPSLSESPAYGCAIVREV